MILGKNNFSFKIDVARLYLLLVVTALALQNILWRKTNHIKVELEVVPTAYNKKTTKAFLFGDGEYYFRLKALKVQNMGDTFGRFTALYKYDYKKLYDWINTLDDIDSKSNFLASMSAYYFSQTQNVEDVRYVVDYLVRHAEKDINKKWWWIYQAAFLSHYILGDGDLTIQIANKLRNLPEGVVPIWLKRNVAFYFSDNGQDCESLRILIAAEKEYGDLQNETNPEIRKKKEIELDYMRRFIESVIEKLKANKIDVAGCMNNLGGKI
jgi:hypothetical protein